MPKRARQGALLGPAAVAIHDDRGVQARAALRAARLRLKRGHAVRAVVRRHRAYSRLYQPLDA